MEGEKAMKHVWSGFAKMVKARKGAKLEGVIG